MCTKGVFEDGDCSHENEEVFCYEPRKTAPREIADLDGIALSNYSSSRSEICD